MAKFDPCSLWAGKPEELVEVEDDGPLNVLASGLGGKIFTNPKDGKLVINLVKEGVYMPVLDREHAANTLLAYKENRLAYDGRIMKLQKAHATSTVAQGMGDAPVDMTEVNPQLAAAYAQEGNRVPGEDTHERFTSGNHSRDTVDKILGAPGRLIDRAVKGGNQRLGTFHFAVAERVLRSLGPYGRALADVFKASNDLKNQMKGEAIRTMNEIEATLTHEERMRGLHDFIVNGTMPADRSRVPVLQAAADRLQQMQDQYYVGAKKVKLKVAEELPEYLWPHRYDLGTLGNEGERRRLVDKVMESGMARSKEEALEVLENLGYGGSRERTIRQLSEDIMRKSPGKNMAEAIGEADELLNQFVSENRDRFSSSLEKTRKVSNDTYIKDTRAWTITFLDNSRRLSEAFYFGPRDERLHHLMGRIKMENGDAASIVNDIYDYETGSKRADVPPWVRGMMDWQAAKLSLSAIWNTTGLLNSVMRMGPTPFIKGVGSAVKSIATKGLQGYRNEIIASGEAGGIPNPWRSEAVYSMTNGLLDRHGSAISEAIKAIKWPKTFAESLELANMTVGASMRQTAKVLASPFNVVEFYLNRGITYHMGQHYTEDILRKMALSQKGSRTYELMLNRLRELNFDPAYVERVLPEWKAGRNLTEKEQFLAMSGARMMRDTQFRPDFQNLPLLSTSPMGRVMLQFKTYPVNQVRFIMRELDYAKHRDPQRVARALSGITLAFPVAGLMLSRLRSKLMGETITGKEVRELYEEGGAGPIIHAGVLAMATGGTLGIAADVVSTAASLNRFQMTSFVVPPVYSSAVNIYTAAAAVAQGLAQGDPSKLRQGVGAGMNEFGGGGKWLQRHLYPEEFGD